MGGWRRWGDILCSTSSMLCARSQYERVSGLRARRASAPLQVCNQRSASACTVNSMLPVACTCTCTCALERRRLAPDQARLDQTRRQYGVPTGPDLAPGHVLGGHWGALGRQEGLRRPASHPSIGTSTADRRHCCTGEYVVLGG